MKSNNNFKFDPSLQGLQVIVGLGKTGLSCLHYLHALGCEIAVTDSRPNPPGLDELKRDFPAVTFSVGQFDAALCARAQQLIVSPGVALAEPAVAAAVNKGIPAIGDIELFVRRATAPIVAITGSNGKSTVTTLVGEMAHAAKLNVKVGGNLGIPVLDLLDDQADLYVLELSSFQLETTHSLQAAAAVILNLSEDHMDRYNGLDAYLQAKQRIYNACKVAIINRDDPLIWKNLALTNTVSFGLDIPQENNFGLRQINGSWYLAQGEKNLLESRELIIKGRHQMANALAALALGQAVQLPMPAMLNALKVFPGLSHRCQWIATYHGVAWYNDSKATNVASAKASIEGLGMDITGKLIVIAGGQGKNADFSPLRESLKQYARLLILIGQDASMMATALKNSVEIAHANSLETAINMAHAQATSGDAVILAPACASFDMFKNFEHRGDMFVQAVRNLA